MAAVSDQLGKNKEQAIRLPHFWIVAGGKCKDREAYERCRVKIERAGKNKSWETEKTGANCFSEENWIKIIW